MSTVSFFDLGFLARFLEGQQRRATRVGPVLKVYIDFLCAGAEEMDGFLTCGFDEGHKRRFLTVAYQLSRVSVRLREKEFQKIMTDITDAIREEIEHDGCAVSDMICAADAIEKGKELIFYLVEGMNQRIQSARDQMVSMGFCEFRGRNADAIFRNLIPFNPDAL